MSTTYAELTLQNSMPSPETQNATSAPRHRTLEPPTIRAKRVPSKSLRAQYVRSLSAWERVDMVLYDLNEKHRWTIKDFVYHLVPNRGAN